MQQFQQFVMQYPWVIYAVIIWMLPWKGIALWKSANNKHKIWFIIIFLFNTLAILDIVYIVFFSRKKEAELIKNNNMPGNGPVVLGNGKKIV